MIRGSQVSQHCVAASWTTGARTKTDVGIILVIDGRVLGEDVRVNARIVFARGRPLDVTVVVNDVLTVTPVVLTVAGIIIARIRTVCAGTPVI